MISGHPAPERLHTQRLKSAMHIVVCVTEVLHPHDVRPPQQGAAFPDGYRMPNRADECAVEMAIRLREAQSGQVTLLSVAPPEAEAVLGMYAGLGVDRVARVWEESLIEAETGMIASVLAATVQRLAPDLTLCGEGAFGGAGSGMTGPLLAEMLQWPFAGGIIEMRDCDEGELILHRLIDRGARQILQAPLPSVIAVSREAETPRYSAWAKRRRAPIEVWDLQRLELALNVVCAAALPAVLTDLVTAKPRPKKLFTPPKTASAADRLRMVMAGGAQKKAQDNLIEGSPDKAAEQILLFLQQESVL